MTEQLDIWADPGPATSDEQDFGESAGAKLARIEREMSAARYSAFIVSDAGQSLLAEVSLEDRARRRETRRFEREIGG